MPLIESYILKNLNAFDLIAVSSNRVYRFAHEGQSYILKINNLPPDDPSPFWQGMASVFGADFDAQRENIEWVLRSLNNPYIPAAQLAFKSDKHRFQVFHDALGTPHEPDAFPDNDAIAYQLGRFIGHTHSVRYDYFGYPNAPIREGFTQKALAFMREIIGKHWQGDAAVEAAYARVSRLDVTPASYSLIMPDISANQFVFTENLASIAAVVDFDAYVIGPVEWELAVIEMCLPDGAAFKRGYEEYSSFPEMRPYRDFYRFYMYLCDPWERQDLGEFMGAGVLF